MKSLSVCITTHNNLEYLKLSIHSLKKHSSLDNQILIYADGCNDGTLNWLKTSNLPFSFNRYWEGIYTGWNMTSGRAACPYMILFSDDMVVSPDWDVNLLKWFEGQNWVVVPRLVEPDAGSYPPPFDCGRDPEGFDEAKFVEYAKSISSATLRGHTFGAYCMLTETFRSVGGFDTRFNPSGVGSLDLALKLRTRFPDIPFFEARNVIFYHFQSKARNKIPNREVLEEESVRKFIEKWGFGPSYERLN